MILQTNIFPVDFNSTPGMFARGDYCFEQSTQVLRLFKGSTITLNTYCNYFSINNWIKRCNIDNVLFSIRGSGKVLLRFFIVQRGNQDKLLAEIAIDFTLTDEYTIPLDFINCIDECSILYPEITAITDSSIYNSRYITDNKERNKVKLGIVITHYNRQQNVLSSIDKLSRSLLNKEGYENIELIIIDNSQNLNLKKDCHKVHVINNSNYGGSGGFARGLLYLKDNGFTHACFMDDDASCPIESIKRTFSFFSFADTHSKLAIAGTLFVDQSPSIVWEAGARFHPGRWSEGIFRGLDQNNLNNILLLEHPNIDPNYGAWCYFSFKISDAKYMPYPFFVRGDDILFGVMNEFSIVTLNGVYSLIDSFIQKDSPVTRYLSFRSEIIISFIMESLSPYRLIRMFTNRHRSAVRLYKYDEAIAIELAALDLVRGSKSLLTDLDGTNFRKYIKNNCSSQQKSKIPETKEYYLHLLDDQEKKESLSRKIIRLLSLNGMLIPDFALSKPLYFSEERYPSASEVFGRSEIHYLKLNNNEVLIATFSRRQIIRRLIQRYIISLKLLLAYKKIKKDFTSSANFMVSEKFWRSLFNL